jgi:fatty acid desaturase
MGPMAEVTVRRIPDPAEPVPVVAWPTLVLLVVSAGTWIASTAIALGGGLPVAAAIAVNAVAAYLLFTVAHDASHHAASRNGTLNRWMGRLSTPFFAPQASFAVWRFIHMQHHRFTNHDDGRDPDHYTHSGPRWQLPLRWLTVDLHYVRFYARHVRGRPRAEKVELGVQLAALAGLFGWAAATGHAVDALLLYLVPSRIAILYLGWAFDYLPHNRLHATPSEDRMRTTRNRVGAERVLSPVLLYQNYHLVHHLHPVVPFYRYLRVWRRNERSYLERGPALSDVWGREITADEYRRLRELAD